jgi:hypothetical protein
VFLLLAFGNLAYIEGLIVGKLWASVAAFGLLVARRAGGGRSTRDDSLSRHTPGPCAYYLFATCVLPLRHIRALYNLGAAGW